ncbi:hypothetical protein H0H81_005949 [Sphagnurus paluster]|uniref:Uncharacterized protein n=1 Tax=Sphagnurus paluster TaxID=117069 RepID=A0A9P7FVI9_9AGAR|nr:hypothetical protein H0H81_005949 [Sphagnurus paluster]
MSPLARGAPPNLFRAVLMNASQLASYDFSKAELLKTKGFDDNIFCHLAASFAASTLGVIRASFEAEGSKFMIKGWVPVWSRLQPTTIVIFLTFEQQKNIVDRRRGKELF